MFAKYWEAGQVKSRLAGRIGAPAASRLYHCFVTTLVTRFEELAERRVLCFTPSVRREAFAALAGATWQLWPQPGGDLGQRMAAFFDWAFAGGASRVVLIGSDSPTLPREFVERAFDALAHHDVVLGPTTDGGYYLVGASRCVEALFQDVPWSTPDVWAHTVARLEAADIAYAELRTWYDVDAWDDLLRLSNELAQSAHALPHGERLRAAVAEVVHGVGKHG